VRLRSRKKKYIYIYIYIYIYTYITMLATLRDKYKRDMKYKIYNGLKDLHATCIFDARKEYCYSIQKYIALPNCLQIIYM